MKKSLSLLVAIAMVFSMFATLVSADGKAAGEKLQGYGIINGTSEGLSEDKDWVRKDVAVLVARLLGKVEEASTHENTHGFEDLDSKFYNGYVSWAKENGFFNGQSATKFAPNAAITNQEFAVVLLRVLNALEEKTSEIDYATALEAAVELGLVSEDLDAKASAVRGDIYEALVTSLDYKIGGKKIGNILGLKDYAIVDLEVVSVKGTNQKTVKVEFNNEIAAVNANNFSVKRADNDSTQIIQNVTVDGNVATIAVVDSLVEGKEYVVKAANVADKEGASILDSQEAAFTYVKAAPASIAFSATTVAAGDTIKLVIKDAEGNDITANYASTDIESVSSSSAVTASGSNITAIGSVSAGATLYAVVSAKIKNTEISTGNVIIYVKDSLVTADSIGKVEIKNAANEVVSKETDLFVFKTATGNKVVAEIVNSNKTTVELNAANNASFKSLNPTVLVVNETTGTLHPVNVGTATIVISGKIGEKTVSKSVIVTVKDDAKATSLEVDKSSIGVVNTATGITNKVKLTLKDQYGNKYSNGSVVLAATTHSTAGVVTATNSSNNFATGEIEVTLAAATTTTKGSTVLTFKVDGTNIQAAVSVNVVDQAAFVGYEVEISDLTVDVNPAAINTENKKNESYATVAVYEKDANGNKFKVVPAADVTLEAAKVSEIVLVDNTLDRVTAVKQGTDVVTVKVNNVAVGTYTFTVVNTTKKIDKVAQSANALTATQGQSDLFVKLFGSTTGNTVVKGIFSATNQYGDAIQIQTSDVTVYTANTNVVTVNGGTITAVGQGTVLLTVVVAGQVFTVNVVVAAPASV